MLRSQSYDKLRLHLCMFLGLALHWFCLCMFQEGPVSHEACQLSHMLKVTASALCNVIGVLVKCEAVWLACLPVQCTRAMARAASIGFAAVKTVSVSLCHKHICKRKNEHHW
jgi:hypothetical protein